MAGDVSAVGSEMTTEPKENMVVQGKEVLSEMNVVVEPGNCFAKLMMVREVETVPGHVALPHWMQQTVAFAANNAVVAAVSFPLPIGLHKLVDVNYYHDSDLEDEDCLDGTAAGTVDVAAGNVLGKSEQVVLSDY